MTHGSKTRRFMRFAACVPLGILAGCGNFASLPSSVEVELPDGSATSAAIGGGAASLADSEWDLYRADDDQYLVRLAFGPEGELEEFLENAVLGADVFGSTVVADGVMRPTEIEGLRYLAGTYGAETEAGFAYEARVRAFFAGVEVGSGRAYARGTHDGERMEGLFGYRTNVTSLAGSAIPDEANGEDEFDFYGLRVGP